MLSPRDLDDKSARLSARNDPKPVEHVLFLGFQAHPEVQHRDLDISATTESQSSTGRGRT